MNIYPSMRLRKSRTKLYYKHAIPKGLSPSGGGRGRKKQIPHYVRNDGKIKYVDRKGLPPF